MSHWDGHWILNGHEVVPVDTLTWAKWFENADRRVGLDEVGPYSVSTVFLGLNHRYDGEGPPLIFETMVFKDKDDVDMERYATWDEAEAGHNEMVRKVQQAIVEKREFGDDDGD